MAADQQPDLRQTAPSSLGRRERGAAVYARIFAVPEEEVVGTFSDRVGSVFAEEALHAAGGASWWQPALTSRDRSIAIITALVAQGVTDDRLLTHLRLGVQKGLDLDALTGLMTLLATYTGYLRASIAMEIVHASLASAGQPNDRAKTAPEGLTNDDRE